MSDEYFQSVLEPQSQGHSTPAQPAGKPADASSVRFLEVGFTLSIQSGDSEAMAGSVARISGSEVGLHLTRSFSALPFQQGDKVRIKYWDWRQGAVAYYWEATVLQIAGPENQEIVISLRGEGVTLQRRRAYRVRVPVPFSFTVIDAAETTLVGTRILNARTQNITVGGLAFGTTIPLNVGDKIELNLRLFPGQRVNGVAWVVRAETIKLEDKHLNSVALEFLQLDPEEQKLLLEFLANPKVSD